MAATALCLVGAVALAPAPHVCTPGQASMAHVLQPRTAVGQTSRREALFFACVSSAALLAAAPPPAEAKIESTNPANNYYFPMAKYRYLPRIFRAWIATSQLGPQANAEGDWEGLQIVWERADDAITALPLYTSAVEGSRSTKRKKKSEAQQKMVKLTEGYKKSIGDLKVAVDRKDKKKAAAALASATEALGEYRVIAQIDLEDGGVIKLPEANALEAGHAGAPLGYVVPVFRGGGIKSDYALR